MLLGSAVAGSVLPEMLTRRRRAMVAKREKQVLEAIFVFFSDLFCGDDWVMRVLFL